MYLVIWYYNIYIVWWYITIRCYDSWFIIIWDGDPSWYYIIIVYTMGPLSRYARCCLHHRTGTACTKQCGDGVWHLLWPQKREYLGNQDPNNVHIYICNQSPATLVYLGYQGFDPSPCLRLWLLYVYNIRWIVVFEIVWGHFYYVFNV